MRQGPSRGALDSRLAAYLDGVVSGAIVAGRLERLAVERHLRDLEDGASRGLRFQGARFARAAWWVESRLNFADDEWAGKPIQLEGWQLFVVAMLCGWERNVDGEWRRRFRVGYLSMARKNAKSTLVAILALLWIFTNGAAVNAGRFAPIDGAELYSAATTRDQAMIAWRAAAKIARRSPKVRRWIDAPRNLAKTTRPNMAYHPSASFFRALASDSDTLDGLNPLFAIVDELHAHKTGAVWDVLESGMGARREPLQIAITTAGADSDGICGQIESNGIKVLERIFDDDAMFVFICRVDEGDDPFDERVWRKSNPNLGVSVHLDGLRLAAKTAAQDPARLSEFLRKRINLWTSGETAWLSMPRWDASALDASGKIVPVDLEALRGERCFVGCDLGDTNDTTAVVAVWPRENGEYLVRPWVFIPEGTVNAPYRGPLEREKLKQWIRDGLVTATAGDMMNHEAIWELLLNLQERYELVEAAFDRWSAASLFGRCEDVGIDAVAFGQGYASMSPAMKFLEPLIEHGKIKHAAHPVLRWMVSNTAIKRDPAGNIKTDKSRRTRRIDAAVATIMAIGIASQHVMEAGDAPIAAFLA